MTPEAKRALKHLDMMNKLKGWEHMTESSLQARSPFLCPSEVGSPLPTAQPLPNRPGSQVKAPHYFSFLVSPAFFFFFPRKVS